jgi:hypothetical protein
MPGECPLPRHRLFDRDQRQVQLIAVLEQNDVREPTAQFGWKQLHRFGLLHHGPLAEHRQPLIFLLERLQFGDKIRDIVILERIDGNIGVRARPKTASLACSSISDAPERNAKGPPVP